MVAQLLRLKLRLLANLFRRSPWQVVGISVGLLYGFAIAAMIFAGLVGLRFSDELVVIRDSMVTIGSIVVLGSLLIPLIVGTDDTMDPRAFALFGMPERTLSFGLAAAAFIGVPAFALAIVLLGTVVTWSRGIPETLLALISAVLLLATCVLAGRVSTAVGSFMLATRRSREFLGLVGILLLVMISPIVVLLTSLDWGSSAVVLLGELAGILGWTPLGAAWAVPGDAAVGDWGAALLKLLIAGVTLWLLWFAWKRLVARMLVTPGREVEAKQYGGIGWFDRLPDTPVGVIAARSFTYWGRDSRYWVSLIMIPVVPIIALVPLSIATVPAQYLALIPVPLMCLFLGWTLHNDVAYDSTAIWLHVASGTRGWADRVGRLAPALVVGIPLIGLGSVVSTALYGDWSALLSLLGVSTCILLSGLGFSSYTSTRFPYPATKPGDSPFAQPQSSDTTSALIQSLTFLGSLVLSAPAIAAAAMGVFGDPAWHKVSLFTGVGIGLIAVVLGVWLGARTFNRRGPEMLASALRA